MAALFRPCAPRDRLGHMRNRGLSDSSGTPAALRAAIDRTGYYPEVVADGVGGAVAGEEVVSYYVHHEPTIERDQVRRHIPVVVLTPPRLILAPTDEHAGHALPPPPPTPTTTHATRSEPHSDGQE